MPKILYNFACRFREEKMFAAIENIILLSRHEDYVIHLTLDLDDIVLTKQSVKEKIKTYGSKVQAHWGISGSKIAAINRDVDLVEGWDYLFNMSDDFVFIKEGFDLDILKEFNEFSGLIHLPDGHANDLLCTFSIMDKAYYEKFNYIYYPEYKTAYCDNEAQDVAKILNCYKFINKKLFLHENPIFGYCEKDDLFLHNQNSVTYAEDFELYQERRKSNYSL